MSASASDDSGRRWIDESSDSAPDMASDESLNGVLDGRSHGSSPPARLAGGRRRGTGWQRVVARIPVRLDPGRRTAMAVGLAVLVAAVLTGAWVLADRPRAMAVTANGSSVHASATPIGSPLSGDVPRGGSPAGSAAPASGAASTGSGGAGLVVVDVAGKVHDPGLYRLPPASRVDDAVKAAGGALSGVNLNSLNLAARVVDGQQIAVGIAAALGADGGSGNGSAAGGSPGGGSPGGESPGGESNTTGLINLNTATAEQLQALPGVGPVLSQNILDWRSAHGKFGSVDQLNDVTGIGTVKFAALRSRVTV